MNMTLLHTQIEKNIIHTHTCYKNEDKEEDEDNNLNRQFEQIIKSGCLKEIVIFWIIFGVSATIHTTKSVRKIPHT